MAARAFAASTSQFRRSALRPAMTTETGRRAVAAMSKAMRAAKPPVPLSRMSQLSCMSGLLHGEPVPAVVPARGQLVLHDALARRALEIGDDRDVAGVLVGGEARAEPARQGRCVDAAAGERLDDKLDLLLADIRRDTEPGAVLDIRVLGGDVLHLPGRDVLAAAAHAVGHAAVEEEVAFGIVGAEVARMQAAAAQGLRGRLRIVEIALEEGTRQARLDDDLAARAGADGLAGLVEQQHLEPGQGRADGADGAAVVEGGDAGGLGHAVALADLDAE